MKKKTRWIRVINTMVVCGCWIFSKLSLAMVIHHFLVTNYVFYVGTLVNRYELLIYKKKIVIENLKRFWIAEMPTYSIVVFIRTDFQNYTGRCTDGHINKTPKIINNFLKVYSLLLRWLRTKFEIYLKSSSVLVLGHKNKTFNLFPYFKFSSKTMIIVYIIIKL